MANALDQGLMLMALGMGTVFGFLGVLVFAVSVMSRLLVSPGADAESSPVAGTASDASEQSVPAVGGVVDDPELVSAIIAAVHRYRGNRS